MLETLLAIGVLQDLLEPGGPFMQNILGLPGQFGAKRTLAVTASSIALTLVMGAIANALMHL